MLENSLKGTVDEIKAILHLLLEQGYLIKAGEKLIVTDKLNKIAKDVSTVPTLNVNPLSLKERFRKFIQDADVPRYVYMNKGKFNETKFLSNASCKEGEKLFEAALKKASYEDLVAATNAHYSDEKTARKTICNYFIEGIWEMMLEDYKAGKLKARKKADEGNRGNTFRL